jgi:hypothetical protein
MASHALKLANELKLTETQRQQVQAIFDRMSAAAKPLGAKLVEREQVLGGLFVRGDITANGLEGETAAIGELQGRLRSVNLATHLKTRALPDSDQIARYQQPRGYGTPLRLRCTITLYTRSPCLEGWMGNPRGGAFRSRTSRPVISTSPSPRRVVAEVCATLRDQILSTNVRPSNP